MSLGYQFRADGNFLVRCICKSCDEPFDAHALSNSDPLGRCHACRSVDEMISQETIKLQQKYNDLLNCRLDAMKPPKVRLTIWQRLRLWFDQVRAK